MCEECLTECKFGYLKRIVDSEINEAYLCKQIACKTLPYTKSNSFYKNQPKTFNSQYFLILLYHKVQIFLTKSGALPSIFDTKSKPICGRGNLWLDLRLWFDLIYGFWYIFTILAYHKKRILLLIGWWFMKYKKQ